MDLNCFHDRFYLLVIPLETSAIQLGNLSPQIFVQRTRSHHFVTFIYPSLAKRLIPLKFLAKEPASHIYQFIVALILVTVHIIFIFIVVRPSLSERV